MWRLCGHYFFHISPSFGASGGWYFVTVALPGYLHIYLFDVRSLTSQGSKVLVAIIFALLSKTCELDSDIDTVRIKSDCFQGEQNKHAMS